VILTKKYLNKRAFSNEHPVYAENIVDGEFSGNYFGLPKPRYRRVALLFEKIVFIASFFT
jgi:hypothetical protein